MNIEYWLLYCCIAVQCFISPDWLLECCVMSSERDHESNIITTMIWTNLRREKLLHLRPASLSYCEANIRERQPANHQTGQDSNSLWNWSWATAISQPCQSDILLSSPLLSSPLSQSDIECYCSSLNTFSSLLLSCLVFICLNVSTQHDNKEEAWQIATQHSPGPELSSSLNLGGSRGHFAKFWGTFGKYFGGFGPLSWWYLRAELSIIWTLSSRPPAMPSVLNLYVKYQGGPPAPPARCRGCDWLVRGDDQSHSNHHVSEHEFLLCWTSTFSPAYY